MATSFAKLTAAACLVAGSLSASPSVADVFSSQGFTGETTTLNALPGVNLDAVPGSSVTGNCTEIEAPAYSFGDRSGFTSKRTECQVGNFTFSTNGGQSNIMGRDPTYNFQPPPWAESWRP